MVSDDRLKDSVCSEEGGPRNMGTSELGGGVDCDFSF